MQPLYEYTGTGMPNVFLTNGFTQSDTEDNLEIHFESPNNLHAVLSNALAHASNGFNLTGPQIKYLRTIVGFSLAEFAAIIGVTEKTAEMWEFISSMPLGYEALLRQSVLLQTATIRPPQPPKEFLETLAKRKVLLIDSAERPHIHLTYQPAQSRWKLEWKVPAHA